MNDLINKRASCNQWMKKQAKRMSLLFCSFFCCSFLIWSHLNRPVGPVELARSAPAAQMPVFIGAEQICLSLCLFVLVFVSLIVCVDTHFCSWPSQVFLRLWQFSAWSPLICLSVYLLSQHSWFIYIYISRKWQQRIIFTSREAKKNK